MYEKIRLEYKKGKSDKFYEIILEGKVVKMNWGRIGQDPTSREKVLSNASAAISFFTKKANEKKKKGYVKVEITEEVKKDEPVRFMRIRK